MKSLKTTLFALAISALASGANVCAEPLRLLLGSGGFYGRSDTTEFLAEKVERFLGASISEVLVVPFALDDPESGLATLREHRILGNRRVASLHAAPNPIEAVEKAQAVLVLGGNTFRLLNALYRMDLLEPLKKRAHSGMPYIGISAGTDIVSPTIMTTNDMPIVQPPSFKALDLVPFQINPHYVASEFFTQTADGSFEKYAGETRDDRIAEFQEANARDVVGIPEATFLLVSGERTIFIDLPDNVGVKKVGRVFKAGSPAVDLSDASDVTAILRK